MDDISFGADTFKGANVRIETLFDVFRDDCFFLAKWASNDERLGRYIESISPVLVTVVTMAQPNGKFLGVPWNQNRYSVSFD